MWDSNADPVDLLAVVFSTFATTTSRSAEMRRVRKKRVWSVCPSFRQPQVLDGPAEHRQVIGRPQPEADEVEACAGNGPRKGGLL